MSYWEKIQNRRHRNTNDIENGNYFILFSRECVRNALFIFMIPLIIRGDIFLSSRVNISNSDGEDKKSKQQQQQQERQTSHTAPCS